MPINIQNEKKFQSPFVFHTSLPTYIIQFKALSEIMFTISYKEANLTKKENFLLH